VDLFNKNMLFLWWWV